MQASALKLSKSLNCEFVMELQLPATQVFYAEVWGLLCHNKYMEPAHASLEQMQSPLYSFPFRPDPLLSLLAGYSTTKSRTCLLCSQVLCCPCYVVIRKCCHEVVAVIVIRLHAELNALVVTSFLGGLHKVLRQQLPLLVEVVSGSLTVLAKGNMKFDRSEYVQRR